MKYTFSDEEDGGSDTPSTRRSNRQSGLSTPAEPARPTVTASGRQVKSRIGGSYGEIMHSKQNGILQRPLNGRDGADDDEDPQALPSRLRGNPQQSNGGQNIGEYDSLDEMDDESDTSSSGHDWDGEDDDDKQDDDDDEDEDEGMSDVLPGDFKREGSDNDDDLQLPRSLVVSLRYHPNTNPPKPTTSDTNEWKPTTDELSGQVPPPEANPFANPRDAGLVPTTLAESFPPTPGISTLPMQNHIELPQELKTKPTDHSLHVPSTAI